MAKLSKTVKSRYLVVMEEKIIPNPKLMPANTNKMKGPASGLAQSIQNAFSSVGTKREES